MKQYYMVYVTANDTLLFKDYINLFLSRKYNPGVSPILLCVVAGGAKKFSPWHRWMLRVIMTMAESGKYIKGKIVILKSNAGWDFGSTSMALKELAVGAQPDDFILIRNRSTWGPHANGWYKNYVDLIESSDQLGLVGSTIGLNDHPSRKREHDVTHVQTYVYLSQWKFLYPLLQDFPGSKSTNHLEAVLQGELQLSQEIMKHGWSIASLKYPELQINFQNQNEINPTLLSRYAAIDDIPIRKDNQERNLQYYVKILLILTTIIWYAIPRRSSYQWINKI